MTYKNAKTVASKGPAGSDIRTGGFQSIGDLAFSLVWKSMDAIIELEANEKAESKSVLVS